MVIEVRRKILPIDYGGAWDTPSEHAKPWKHHAGPESGQENPWGAILKQIEASAQRNEGDI